MSAVRPTLGARNLVLVSRPTSSTTRRPCPTREASLACIFNGLRRLFVESRCDRRDDHAVPMGGCQEVSAGHAARSDLHRQLSTPSDSSNASPSSVFFAHAPSPDQKFLDPTMHSPRSPLSSRHHPHRHPTLSACVAISNNADAEPGQIHLAAVASCL